MKATSLLKTQEQRVVVYGPPKSGKTELVGRLAREYKLLVFSLENGHSTLLKFPQELLENIEIIIIRDSRDYPIAAETMLKVIRGDPTDICVDHSKVSCAVCKKNPAALWEHVHLKALGPEWIVVIDSLTQLTNSFIAHITKNQDDLYKLQLDDWGALRVLIDKFLSCVQVAPYNVVCITHEEEVKFEDGRAKIVPVAGSSNSSRNTAKYFDHVVYCNLVNKKHVVGSATDYNMSVLTGSRTDVKLESSKDGASLLDMFTTWREKKGWSNGENMGSTIENNNSGNILPSSSITSVDTMGINNASGSTVVETDKTKAASTLSGLAERFKNKGVT